MLKKIKTKLPILILDGAMIPIAWFAAFWLRFNLEFSTAWQNMNDFWPAAGLMMGFQVLSYYYFHVYRAVWRFISLNDVLILQQSVLISSLFMIPCLYFGNPWIYLPRSIVPLYFICLVVGWSALRVARRLSFEILTQKGRGDLSAQVEATSVLIIGAGRAGANLVRDLLRDGAYHVCGFVDDDVKKQGLTIHGVKVLGPTEILSELIRAHAVQRMIIAIPSMKAVDMRRVVAACEQTKVSFHTLPSVRALANGDVSIQAIRPVSIEDLLGRDEVELNIDVIAEQLEEHIVLVSGAGGSIGSELCRQILKFCPKQLILVDHSEYLLYQIEQELKLLIQKEPYSARTSLKVCLLSVTDGPALDACFEQYRPDYVFHAAAYKHVPMLELQVRSALLNNVVGTWTMADKSAQYQVKKFVLISTDKAVNPTNIMGACKRMAEIIVQNFNHQTSTKFITVRFGNVLGSAGSVVPKFYEQIKQGGPVTVTHPEMVRYFMTIPEASRLILQAMGYGQGGEIFVLDMGDPVNITYLAQQMIRLSRREVAITYTGLRPGEKLYEELFYGDETLQPTEHVKLYRAQAKSYDGLVLADNIQQIQHACATNHQEMMMYWIKTWVPEYDPARHEVHPKELRCSQISHQSI